MYLSIIIFVVIALVVSYFDFRDNPTYKKLLSWARITLTAGALGLALSGSIIHQAQKNVFDRKMARIKIENDSLIADNEMLQIHLDYANDLVEAWGNKGYIYRRDRDE